MSDKSKVKYRDFQYPEFIENKLKYELNKQEQEKLNEIYKQLNCKDKVTVSRYIVEDFFKLVYIYKLSTKILAEIYDVGVRTIQIWKKDMSLSKNDLINDEEYQKKRNDFDEFKIKCKKNNNKFIGVKYNKWTVLDIDYYKSYTNKKIYFICICDCIHKTVRSVEKNSLIQGQSKSCGCKILSTKVFIDDCDTRDKKYCLYRFLDKNKNVLYIGKCEKSFHSNGRNGLKEYFLKDRLSQHFSPSSKQLPKSLYLNTKYIEVAFPNVKNNEELERLESQLISYYEREKLQCNYNLDLLSHVEYINEDKQSWILYEEKTNRDIDNLLFAYKMSSIPPIETINERLRAIIWIKNKQ